MSEAVDMDLLRNAVAEGGPVTIGHGYAARLVECIEALEGLLREARPHVEGDWTPDCIGARDCKCGRCGLKRRIDAALAGGAK